MDIQYISDQSGKTTSVVIPIEEWERLKKKYTELEKGDTDNSIPEWQIVLGRREIENIENGKTELTKWEEVKSRFKF